MSCFHNPDPFGRSCLKETGNLVQVFPDHQATATDLDVAIYAIYPHTRYQSPKVRAFVDFLADLFSDFEGSPSA